MEDPSDLELDELSAKDDAPPAEGDAPPTEGDAPPTAAAAAEAADDTADAAPEADPDPHPDPHPDRDRDDDGPRSGADLEAVYDVPVQVSAGLGKAPLQVSQLLKLGRGAVVELDRKVGEAIDIYINDRLVARGEVVVVEDRLGVTMTEIIKSDHR